MEKQHDYKDTIKEAAELEGDGKAASERERKTDNEIAYEAFAVTSAMNMLGMEQEGANLCQLELAQEIMYIDDPQTHNDDNLD